MVETDVPGVSRGRVVVGWVLALLGPVLLTALLRVVELAGTSEALTFLALTVLVALVGGRWPAVAAALLASLALNWFFTAPLGTLAISDGDDVVALVVFLVVALAVASVVDLAARRAVHAQHAREEADALARLNGELVRGPDDLDGQLRLTRELLGVGGVRLLATPGSVLAEDGDVAAGPVVGTTSGPVRLEVHGRRLTPREDRLLAAFGDHLAAYVERQRLAAQAAEAARLEQGNRLRTALLAAVSHDLRTPLAGIKAAASTLRTPGVEWAADDRAELLAAIEESTDRLGAIIANLLDLSRLQTGGVTLVADDIGLDDVVARAVAGLPEATPARLVLRLPHDLPAVRVDAGLLERVVANLVDNALRHTRGAVEVLAATDEGRVRLHVVDHGPGIPDAAKRTAFEPFQRLGDAPAGAGVGLGLAVARGLTVAMDGTLTAHDTEGGGLTMTVDLPAVS